MFKNMKNLIPDKPKARLLHGDLWEGNILFKKKKFIGFIDPGSFFGHNEMEIAYLRWFNPSFIDINFLDKYNDYIKIEKINNKNTCTISSPFIQNTKFNYKMTDSGIEETESI